MEAIENFFNFTNGLAADVKEDVRAQCSGPHQFSDGEPEVRHFSVDGQAINVTQYRDGDWCGDINVMDGRPRLNTGLAVGDVEILILKSSDFLALCERHPTLLLAYSVKQSYVIRLLISMLVDFSVLALSGRLVRTLLRLLIGQGKEDENGESYIECSQEEIARYLAVSRQSASTELKKLEKTGAIRIAYGKIYIVDTQALNDACEKLTSYEPVAATYQP
jgi:CRP-like cAMP-binding protein